MLELLPEGPAAKTPQLGHWLLVLANALQQNLATGIRAQLGRAATLAELTPPRRAAHNLGALDRVRICRAPMQTP